MMRRFAALILLGFGMGLNVPMFAEAAWKAGVAKVVITPDKPMWMSGYAGRDHAAEGKLTDLWAKALVLEDPRGQRVALVTLDLVGIDRATSHDIRDRLDKQFGLSRKQVALCCSHTHTGPVVGRNLRAMYFLDDAQGKLVDQYTARLVDMVVGTVGEARINVAAKTIVGTMATPLEAFGGGRASVSTAAVEPHTCVPSSARGGAPNRRDTL